VNILHYILYLSRRSRFPCFSWW